MAMETDVPHMGVEEEVVQSDSFQATLDESTRENTPASSTVSDYFSTNQVEFCLYFVLGSVRTRLTNYCIFFKKCFNALISCHRSMDQAKYKLEKYQLKQLTAEFLVQEFHCFKFYCLFLYIVSFSKERLDFLFWLTFMDIHVFCVHIIPQKNHKKKKFYFYDISQTT